MAVRSGDELWDQLDNQTAKRIKGHWRKMPKMVRLLTLANDHRSLGMTGDEIDRLAQHVHDANNLEETMERETPDALGAL
jgi:hypothetical protein